MTQRAKTNLVIFAFLVLIAGCGRDDPESPPEATPAPEPAPPEQSNEPAVADAEQVYSELAGTGWQLVKIASMNDTESVPDDGSKYTLVFGEDGRAMVVADCNRGTGTYTSLSQGQLEFGPIATTMMACGDESMGNEFLSQFEWVRSYVLENGHLFLATMADGSIIEFEPISASVD